MGGSVGAVTGVAVSSGGPVAALAGVGDGAADIVGVGTLNAAGGGVAVGSGVGGTEVGVGAAIGAGAEVGSATGTDVGSGTGVDVGVAAAAAAVRSVSVGVGVGVALSPTAKGSSCPEHARTTISMSEETTTKTVVRVAGWTAVMATPWPDSVRP